VKGQLAVKPIMYTTYFDEYQKQLNDWQKQFSEWQKKFYDVWLENLPTGKVETNFSETFDKALNFQQELVKAFLDNQEKASKMMVDSQKQFWNDYFEKLRNQTTANGL
jgi:hypothetical protein